MTGETGEGHRCPHIQHSGVEEFIQSSIPSQDSPVEAIIQGRLNEIDEQQNTPIIIIIISVLLISGGENRYKIVTKQLSDDIDWVRLVRDYNPPVDS